MTVIKDQTAHVHICPICDQEHWCTEDCVNQTYILCNDCSEDNNE
jgi:hypothetical protein